MSWNKTTTNKYLSNKTTGKLTEHFQEFTQGDEGNRWMDFKIWGIKWKSMLSFFDKAFLRYMYSTVKFGVAFLGLC